MILVLPLKVGLNQRVLNDYTDIHILASCLVYLTFLKWPFNNTPKRYNSEFFYGKFDFFVKSLRKNDWNVTQLKFGLIPISIDFIEMSLNVLHFTIYHQHFKNTLTYYLIFIPLSNYHTHWISPSLSFSLTHTHTSLPLFLASRST